MRYFPVIVVGAGLAGMRAALEVNRHNVKVALFSRVHPLRSHSVAAQGGINGALGNHHRGMIDSPELHAFDTIKGSDYLADQNVAMRMCREAPDRIFEMEHWGTPFTRTVEGRIAQRPFGGAGFPRTAYAADLTGHVLLHTLFEQIVRFEEENERDEMNIFDEWFVTNLVIEGDEIRGIIAIEMKTGHLEGFLAEAVIFATGGAGRIYGKTTNSLISTGLGMAIPYWNGIPLRNMEFIQFHPTSLYGTNILITEGCRGEGGILLNNRGERFLANYPDSKKAMEIAPRDIVARNMKREILEGRGFEDAYLHLDIRHLGEKKIQTRLPGIRNICLNFAGIDPVYEPIPVQPAQHYTMGGIDCNGDCETEVKGFYAAGECACNGVHGANRLGGNSMLETLVFGKIAGENAAKYAQKRSISLGAERLMVEALKKEEIRIEELRNSDGDEMVGTIKKELNDLMDSKVGIFRDRETLETALKEVGELEERFKKIKTTFRGLPFSFELFNILELKANIDVAKVIIKGALLREESRGSHFRLDFPKRDDANWLKHTVARFTPDGPEISYRPVDISLFEPRERKY